MADLAIFGSEDGALLTLLNLLGDPDDDTISFPSSISTHGHIRCPPTPTTSRSPARSRPDWSCSGNSTADSGSIDFEGREINSPTGSALLAQVETGSVHTVGDVTLNASAASIVRTLNTPRPVGRHLALGSRGPR